MKKSVTCPSCTAKFNVSEDNKGKRAKCPKCDERFVITFDADEPVQPQEILAFDDVVLAPIAEMPATMTARPPSMPSQFKPARQAPTKSTNSKTEGKKLALPLWSVILAASVASLILGYFIGREHIKYQFRSALQEAGQAFQQGLEAGFKDPESGEKDLASTQPTETQPNETTEEVKPLAMGESFDGGAFLIALQSASIEKPKIIDMFGGSATAQEAALVFTFSLINKDERKIIRFRESNMFSVNNFRLRDDVDNVIRGISYGAGSHPVGALTGKEDIAPGDNVSHVEVFSVPPPKTQSLVLTVDLACLGESGTFEVTVPSSSITGLKTGE